MTRLGNNVLQIQDFDYHFNIILEIDLQLTEFVVAAFTAISVLV
jgi:hypothetical protein